LSWEGLIDSVTGQVRGVGLPCLLWSPEKVENSKDMKILYFTFISRRLWYYVLGSLFLTHFCHEDLSDFLLDACRSKLTEAPGSGRAGG